MQRQMSRRSRQLRKKQRVGIRARDFIAVRSCLSCPFQLLCLSCILRALCRDNIQLYTDFIQTQHPELQFFSKFLTRESISISFVFFASNFFSFLA
jgi:hypothetical protein